MLITRAQNTGRVSIGVAATLKLGHQRRVNRRAIQTTDALTFQHLLVLATMKHASVLSEAARGKAGGDGAQCTIPNGRGSAMARLKRRLGSRTKTEGEIEAEEETE